MDLAKLANRLEILLRKTFPGVIVRQDREVPNDGDEPVFDVFMVHDDQAAEFIKYGIEKFSTESMEAGLPEVSLISHCVTSTLEHYPDVVRIKGSAKFRVTKAKPASANRVIKGAGHSS